MSQSYVCLYFHIIWATKKRLPLINYKIKDELHQYIKKKAVQQEVVVININGIYDHVHMLIKTKKFHEIPKFMKIIKSSSSKYANEISGPDYFMWQSGYSIFTVSPFIVPKVKRYIDIQEQRHRTQDFEAELKILSNW